MKMIKWFYITVVFFLVVSCATADNKNVVKKLFLTAKVTDVTLIEPISSKSIASTSRWRVHLKNVNSIDGDIKVDKYPNEVILDAIHGEELLEFEKIFIVLEVQNEKVTVLYWEQVVSLVCVPKELIPAEDIDSYFDDKWGDKTVKCTFLR